MDPFTNGSPQLFSTMQLVLPGLTWEEVIVYLDDVIVLGTDFDDALLALRKFFTCFCEHGLKLKPKKCHFFKEEVEFLGKLVSGSPHQCERTSVFSWFHELS